MTPWKYSADGKSASRILDNGASESRSISAIPASELATALPADPIIAQPDGAGFIQAIKTAMGGILGANALIVSYPAFMPAVQQSDWLGVQSLILDANTKAVITPVQYAAIKTAAVTFHIPVTLP